MTEKKPIIVLEPSCDPCGRGFTGCESKDGGINFFYRGDIGTMSRAAWRAYAKHWGYTLREWKNKGLAAQYENLPHETTDGRQKR